MPLKQKDILLQALEIVIDGVSLSTNTECRAQGGAYLAKLLLDANENQLDEVKKKMIISLVKMANEAESPAFKL